MAVGPDEVRRVAALARLRLEEAEVERLTRDLSRILGHVEKISSLDLSGIEPTAHVLELGNAFRDDRTEATLPRQVALGNAPEAEGGLFVVPPVMRERGGKS